MISSLRFLHRQIVPFLIVICCLLFALLAFGCSPYVPLIRYEPTQALVASPQVSQAVVVTFADNRGTDAHWLGAVRNGVGAVVKKLLTDRPTSEVVRDAFVEALAARKITESESKARIAIKGTIIKFDCSTVVNYEAHAHLQVNVVSLPSGELIYSQSYRTDNTESGFGGGLYGGYKDLAQLAQQTLNQTIDKVFADPVFVAALTNTPNQSGPSAGQSISDRLRSLEQLKADGLISKSEYEAKRKELLGEL